MWLVQYWLAECCSQSPGILRAAGCRETSFWHLDYRSGYFESNPRTRAGFTLDINSISDREIPCCAKVR
jgi:hypothetical protein